MSYDYDEICVYRAQAQREQEAAQMSAGERERDVRTTRLSPLPNIALLGRLRSGKDTVGDYLASKYGYTQFAFGDELKTTFHRVYPDVPRSPKPRAGYQEFGQKWRSTFGESVWISACFRNIERNAAEPVVICDTRQVNEWLALYDAGYVLIRVEAPDGLRIERAVNSGDTFAYADLMHGTETALDGYAADFTVTNDAGLAELYAQIDEIIAYLTLKNGGAA